MKLCFGRTQLPIVSLFRTRGHQYGHCWLFFGKCTVVPSFLLLRTQSLPADIVNNTSANGLCVGSKENSQQLDEMWLNFAKLWIPKCETSFENHGATYIDGHPRNGTASFKNFSAQYILHVVIEPSHRSMIYKSPMWLLTVFLSRVTSLSILLLCVLMR